MCQRDASAGFSLSLVQGGRRLRINRESTRHLLICERTPELMLPQLLTHFLPPGFDQPKPVYLSVLCCHSIFPIPSASFPVSAPIGCLWCYIHACRTARSSVILLWLKPDSWSCHCHRLPARKALIKTSFECLTKVWNNLPPTVPLNTIRSPL